MDEREDGAVEAVATRKSDGETLAIEHTIIEPFLRDKEDFAQFEAGFLEIEQDETLIVAERWTRVFIPVGTLHSRHKQEQRRAIVEGIHNWLKEHIALLPYRFLKYACPVTMPRGEIVSIAIYTDVIPLRGVGKFQIRRQQMESNLDKVIERALRNKLPKLTNTNADKRLLFLERQHMNLFPKAILDEIEKQKATFPGFVLVEEIWIIETMIFESEGYVRFELFKDGALASSIDFLGSRLFQKFEYGKVSLGPAALQTIQ
jgi:hypothetical protein